MNNENNNIGHCLTKKESKQAVLGKLSDSVGYVKQIGHILPEKIISDIRFWLNENIDCFEKFSKEDKIKLIDDLAQLKLSIDMVEQWFASQARDEIGIDDDVEEEPEISPVNPLTSKF